MRTRRRRAAALLATLLGAGIALGALGRLSGPASELVAGGGLLVMALVSYCAILFLVEGRGGGGYAQTMALSWGAVGAAGGSAGGRAGVRLVTGASTVEPCT